MSQRKKSNHIKITRDYKAPVKAVWDAWTDLKQVAQWWGPRGFTITTHHKDLREGGTWKYTMHGPDGVDYPNLTKYFEVIPCERLVYDHGGTEDRPPLFRVTATFKEIKGGTRLEMTMTLPTPEAAEETKKFIKKAGGNGTWDRLGEFLEKQTAGREVFIINRSFETSVDRMYQMWTDPEHVAKWTPPTGFTMKFFKVDIKEGGGSFYVITNGKDVTMYGRTKYLELKRNEKVMYTQQFCDEHENISRHPLAPVWPETMLTQVFLASEVADDGGEQTRVTIIWEPHGQITAEELEVFKKARAGMTQGWTGSFDKLEAHLAD